MLPARLCIAPTPIRSGRISRVQHGLRSICDGTPETVCCRRQTAASVCSGEACDSVLHTERCLRVTSQMNCRVGGMSKAAQMGMYGDIPPARPPAELAASYDRCSVSLNRWRLSLPPGDVILLPSSSPGTAVPLSLHCSRTQPSPAHVWHISAGWLTVARDSSVYGSQVD